MPKFGPHLKDIEAKAKARLDALGLVPDYDFDARKHRERFYTVPCRDAEGNRFVFKMRTEDHRATRSFFRREIGIIRQFARRYSAVDPSPVPRFVAGDIRRSPEWMVYEFIPGTEAGDFYNGFSADKAKDLSLRSLVAAMKDIRDFSDSLEDGIDLRRKGYRDCCRDYAGYRELLRPFFSETEIGQAERMLRSGKELLDLRNTVITHGDLHPGNLIIIDRRHIAIIDWYSACFDNAAADPAFLYLEIVDRSLGKRLLRSCVRAAADGGQEFLSLFLLDILRFVPQKIGVLHDALYVENPGRDDYYAKLTPTGVAKLEHNLAAFRQVLEGGKFL